MGGCALTPKLLAITSSDNAITNEYEYAVHALVKVLMMALESPVDINKVG